MLLRKHVLTPEFLKSITRRKKLRPGDRVTMPLGTNGVVISVDDPLCTEASILWSSEPYPMGFVRYIQPIKADSSLFNLVKGLIAVQPTLVPASGISIRSTS